MARIQPIQTFFTGYSEAGRTGGISSDDSQQIKVMSLAAHNRSGGAVNCGLLKKLSNDSWKLWQDDASDSPNTTTELTSLIQAGSDVDIFTTTDSDGFVFQASKKFGLLGFTVSQADGGGATYTYEYFNGTAWTSLTGIALPSAYSSTGQVVIVFSPPLDWATGANAVSEYENLDSDKYSIRVLATTSGAAVTQATEAWAGEFIVFQEALADNSTLSVEYDALHPLWLESKENVIPYFGTASAANIFSGSYSLTP